MADTITEIIKQGQNKVMTYKNTQSIAIYDAQAYTLLGNVDWFWDTDQLYLIGCPNTTFAGEIYTVTKIVPSLLHLAMYDLHCWYRDEMRTIMIDDHALHSMHACSPSQSDIDISRSGWLV